jgi:hypothetical protein
MYMMLNYYNNLGGNFVSAPHPPSYYVYGGGGSGYYSPSQTDSTLDAFFTDLPNGFVTALQADIANTTAMGIKRVAYEGGPGLDKLGNAVDAISPMAILDPRLKTAMINLFNSWSNNGGDLFMYYTATGDFQWGFTSDVTNLSTMKLQAIDSLNATPRAAITYGNSAPGSVSGTMPDACSRGWGCYPLQPWDNFTSTSILWANYSFRSTVAAKWSINLDFTNANAASVSVYVDGNLVGTQSTTGGALTFNAGSIPAGLHGVIVKSSAGSFQVKTVTVGNY